MINNLNQQLNSFLDNERLTKEEFNDLKNIAEFTSFNKNILKWFRFSQKIEIIGWRPKNYKQNF